MFKSVRRRGEKSSKITALFKLRFHATQLGGKALVLSVVPTDTGKPTARLEKAVIREGSCFWDNPVFERVIFAQDQKTGKVREKIYHFVISTVSSKYMVVGEVSINIADYADAFKAASVSLPFKSSSSETVLHISIQRIQENADQGEMDVEDEVLRMKSEDRSLKRHFSNGDAEESMSVNFTEAKPPMKTVSNIADLRSDLRSSIGSDTSLSSSELNTPRKNGSNSITMPLDPVNLPDTYNQQTTRSDSSSASTHDQLSTDDSSNSPSGSSQLNLDDPMEKLKSDLLLLSRKAELSDLELNTLRKQIIKESKRSQDLLKEVVSLKVERDAIKEDYEKLKTSNKRIDDLKARNRSSFEGYPWALLDETRQELSYEKDLNTNLRIQLQKTQEANSELILAVQDLEHMLEQKSIKNCESARRTVSSKSCELQGGNVREGHSQSDDDEEQKALEELVKEHTEAKEAYILEQRIMDLSTEIEMYRRDKDELEMQMEQLALDYEIMKQENHDMSHKLEQIQHQEQLKIQYECNSSFATVNDLKNKVENLESELEKRSSDYSASLARVKEQEKNVQALQEELEKQSNRFEGDLETLACAKVEQEQLTIRAEEDLRLTREDLENRIDDLQADLKKQTKESSKFLATIKELETHIQSLEEDLEKQAQGFEADLEAVTRAKVEEEKRAIKAEEALRLTRLKNANTAEMLQDEFKRLSMQMQSSFEANQKVASKALTEVSELRLLNRHLEEALRLAQEEVESVKDDCEVLVMDLRHQISSKAKQIDQLLADIQEKSKQIESQKEKGEEACESLSAELLTLKDEIERLTSDTTSLSEKVVEATGLKAELEQVKALIKERDLLVQRKEMEKQRLEAQAHMAKKNAKMPVEKLDAGKYLKDEKQVSVTNLQSDVDTLSSQCEKLKNSLYEDELEKEKLRKQVLQLKTELKKKDDMLIMMERKLKDNNGRVTASERIKALPKSNKLAEVGMRGSREAASLREKIKLLEAQIKLKETALETSVNAFLEKEKDLHSKIEELEKRLEELNQTSKSYCEDEGLKVNGGPKHVTLNINSEKECQILRPVINESDITTNSESGSQQDIDTLLKEMESMRQKNTCMETDLREMQDRYSEISLKFAEVEGERQKLVMALRNLKNAKKS